MFEQQLTKDISFKECLELQMEILENGKKPEERNNLNVSSKKSEVEDQVSEDRVGTVPEEKKKRMKKSYVVTDIPCNFCPNVFGSKATIKVSCGIPVSGCQLLLLTDPLGDESHQAAVSLHVLRVEHEGEVRDEVSPGQEAREVRGKLQRGGCPGVWNMLLQR